MKKISIAGISLVLALAFITPGFAQNAGTVKAQEAKTSAQERVKEIKEKVALKKAEVKEKVCEKRQEILNDRLANLSTQSAKLKTKIDSMYIRIQGFYDSGQLTVSNYDELRAAVDTASADADAAVSTVESFEFTLDCENVKLGEQLDGFRTAIGDTRIALKDYRKALVGLISAMRSASAEEKAKNTESGEDGDKDEVSTDTEDTNSTEDTTDSTTDNSGEES